MHFNILLQKFRKSAISVKLGIACISQHISNVHWSLAVKGNTSHRPGISSSELVRLKEGESTLGRSGACFPPGKFLNWASLKCTFGAFSERINQKINQNLRWQLLVFSSKFAFIATPSTLVANWIPLSQFVAIFLLDDVALLLYALLILKVHNLFNFFLKMRPSSKVGPAIARPTGQVPPGLSHQLYQPVIL